MWRINRLTCNSMWAGSIAEVLPEGARMCHLPRRDRCKKVLRLESTRRHIRETARIDQPVVQGFNVSADLKELSGASLRDVLQLKQHCCHSIQIMWLSITVQHGFGLCCVWCKCSFEFIMRSQLNFTAWWNNNLCVYGFESMIVLWLRFVDLS